MRKRIDFQSDMEALAEDFDAIQGFVQEYGDNAIFDWLSTGKAYSGFNTTRSNATELAVAPGRLYSAGVMYGRDLVQDIDITQYLPTVGKKILALVVYGQEVGDNNTTRNFLIDVDTGEQQPRQVTLETHRRAIITVVAGAEAGTPVKPEVPAQYTVFAWVTITPTGIAAQSSIVMEDATEVASLMDAWLKFLELEVWKRKTDQDIAGLRSLIADIMELLRGAGDVARISELAADIARLKEEFGLSDDRASYAADRYMDEEESDPEFTGYQAKVAEGLRFSAANADIIVPDLLNPIDPNVKVSPGGLMLPVYDATIWIAIGDQAKERDSEVPIAQYGTANFTGFQLGLSRARTRYGEEFEVCANSRWWQSGQFDPVTGIFKKDGETFEAVTNPDTFAGNKWIRLRKYWLDVWSEPWWQYTGQERNFTGKLIAETFLCPGNRWVTAIDLWLTQRGPAGDVLLVLCETEQGAPNLDRIIAYTTVAHANLVAGNWTRFPIEPTFLSAGRRYAIVVVSSGDHRFAISTDNDYKSGSFFYSADGAYNVIDPAKDLCFQIVYAHFRHQKTIVELDAWNLDGGIASIDVIHPGVYPKGTAWAWQFRIGSEWHTIGDPQGGPTPLAALPPLLPARVNMTHTNYAAPGFQLTTSRVLLSRPRTTMTHVSAIRTLPAASDQIRVDVTLANYVEAQHNWAIKLLTGATFETEEAADSVTDTELPDGRIRRTAIFNLDPAIDEYRIKQEATATSAVNVPLAEERVDQSF